LSLSGWGANSEVRAFPGSADNFTMSAHQELGSNLTLNGLLGRCLAEKLYRILPDSI